MIAQAEGQGQGHIAGVFFAEISQNFLLYILCWVHKRQLIHHFFFPMLSHLC